MIDCQREKPYQRADELVCLESGICLTKVLLSYRFWERILAHKLLIYDLGIFYVHSWVCT